jgi:integrase/recombinase XerC
VDVQHFKRFLDNDVLPTRQNSPQTKDVLDVTRDDIQLFADYLTRDYKPRTINRKIAALGAFYRFLIKKGFLEKSPIHHEKKPGGGLDIRKPRVPKEDLVHISDDNIKMLLESIDPDSKLRKLRDKALYSLMALAGLKAPELQSMTLGDVDITDKTVKIIRRKELVFIPVDHELLSVIETYYFARLDNNDSLTDSDFLFINKHGKSLSCRSMRRNLVRYALEAGIRVNPSQLRHSFAINAVRQGVDLTVLQQQLGHLAKTTMKAYKIPQDMINLGDAAPIEEVEPIAEVTTCEYVG